MATITVLTEQQRQGTFTSASLRIPSTVTGTLAAYGTATNAVLADPANVVRMAVYVSADEGASWRYAGGIEWQGGSANKDGSWNRPGLVLSGIEVLRGLLARVEVDVPPPSVPRPAAQRDQPG